MLLYYIQHQHSIMSQSLDQVNQIKKNAPLVISEYQRAWIRSRLHPEDEELQQMLQSAQHNLDSLLSGIKRIQSDAQHCIAESNQQLIFLNESIQKEQTASIRMKSSAKWVENKTNASHEMIHDYQHMYESHYLNNWGLFLSLIALLISVVKIYHPPTVLV